MNQESLDDLHSNLAEHNRSLEEVPHTFHWNKRDLGDLLSVEDLDKRYNVHRAPSLGTVATKGEGVFDGLERIARLVLKAYERDPKVRIEATSESGAREFGSEPRISEEGIALALRQMETGSAAQAGIEAPTKISQALPEPAPRARSDKPARDGEQKLGSGAWTRFVVPEPPSDAGLASSPALSSGPALPSSGSPRSSPLPPPVVTTTSSNPAGVAFSMADLFPEAERDRVRQAESMLAARDAVNAILACDVLVTRVLASAAGLVGTLDAPRDPALVSILLGLDGPRYLQFRTLVRAARHRETVSMKDAFECFTFSIEARRAREALRR